jgi:hypothetical protein
MVHLYKVLSNGLIIFIFSFGFSQICRSQGEGNIWYFGNLAGIDFNSGSAVALTNGALSTLEGCASICDASGTLLFYTDGVTVYNANHLAMPNGTGLNGDENSTQSAIIVKKPGSTNIYYIFTTDLEGNSDGLQYSEVDMSLQGGLGDVTSNMNIPLLTPACEKIVAVRHQNNTDFWVVAHFYGSDAFYSYLVSASGVSSTPIISNVGASLSTNFINTLGQLKANKTGDRIANALYHLGEVELFDFDNSTGVLSNAVNLTIGVWCYGVEFSPNGNLLYATWSGGNIAQYDLTAGTATAIENTEVNLGPFLFDFITALQIAPDGKIYAAVDNSPDLGVISNPDILGVGCNFNVSGFSLGGASSNQGLPNFLNSFTPIENLNFTICVGDSVGLTSVVNSVFNWADSSALSTIISQDSIFYVSPTSSASYVLYGNVDTLVYTVTVNTPPTFDLGNDTTFCSGGFVLNLTALNLPVVWHNGSTAPVFFVDTSGIYWADVTNDCGTTRDSIVVINGSTQATLNNVVDASCANSSDGSATVSGVQGSSAGPYTITWTDPDGNTHFTGPITIGGSNTQTDLGQGQWNVTVSDGNGCDWTSTFIIGSGSINFTVLDNDPQCPQTPTGSIVVNTMGQGNYTFTIVDDQGNQVNATGTNAANNLLAGTYIVTYSDDNGCVISDNFTLVDPPLITPTIVVTNPLCYGDAAGSATVSNIINYQGNVDSIFYVWTPNPSGTNGLNITYSTNLPAGDYSLEVTDQAGCVNDVLFSVVDPDELIGEITDVIPTMCRTAGFQSGNGVVAAQTQPGSSGTGSTTYNWEHLGTGQNANTSTFVVRSPGLVELTVTDANGCIYKDTVQVDSLNPIADFEITSDQFLTTGVYEGTEDVKIKITNLSENFAQANNPNSDTIFQWNLFTNQQPSSDQNWFFTYDIDEKVDTTYDGEQVFQVCLITKNFNDCVDTLCKDVTVHAITDLQAPNVFTPGTSPNQYFFFPGQGIGEFSCQVFNRYGVKVFEFNDITDQWDGNHYRSGAECSEGVYFYTYTAKSTNGQDLSGDGQIHLVRKR